MVLDEVQRSPGVFDTLRPICNDSDRVSVFLLFGSASPDVVRGISETLVGRIRWIDLPAASLTDVATQHQSHQLMRGGFPLGVSRPSDPPRHLNAILHLNLP